MSDYVHHDDISIVAGDDVELSWQIIDTDSNPDAPLDLTGYTIEGQVRSAVSAEEVLLDLADHLEIGPDPAQGEFTVLDTIGDAVQALLVNQGNPKRVEAKFSIRLINTNAKGKTYVMGSFFMINTPTRP